MATNSINAHYKGTAGENEVARILSGFNRQRYIVLNNILLRKPYVRSGEVPTVQIDHIVVSVFGIFIIETKNYSGKIYGYEESKEWSVYLGGQKYPMQNPLRQNHSHSKTIQQLLVNNAAQIGIINADFLIYPIIAFSNKADISKVQVQGVDVINFHQIPDAILRKSTRQVISPEQMENIAGFIASQNIYSPETIRKHVEDIQRLKNPYAQNRWTLSVGNVANAGQNFRPKEMNPKEAEFYAALKERDFKSTQYSQFSSDNAGENYSRKGGSGGWKKGYTIIIIVCAALVILPLMVLSGLFVIMPPKNNSNNTGNINNSNAIVTSTSKTAYEKETEDKTGAKNVEAENAGGDEYSSETEGMETESELPKPNLPDKNITGVEGTIYQPRDVTDDIVYICHGSAHIQEQIYTDKDGDVYDQYIEMYHHASFHDGIFIDIRADSYDTLSFTYTAAPHMFYDKTILKIQVIDPDTDEILYVTDKVRNGHSDTTEVYIGDRNNIRLNFVEENGGACMCYVKDIILSNEEADGQKAKNK